MRKSAFYIYEKTKAQISCAVTMQLISLFILNARIVQFLDFLNPKFQTLVVRLGLCPTWLETKKTDFLTVKLYKDDK